jgi:hypothetical protein
MYTLVHSVDISMITLDQLTAFTAISHCNCSHVSCPHFVCAYVYMHVICQALCLGKLHIELRESRNYDLPYSLTNRATWSTVSLEKLIVIRLVNKFAAFMGSDILLK